MTSPESSGTNTDTAPAQESKDIRELNNLLATTLVAAAGFFLLVLVAYIVRFYGQGLGTNSETWGQFGDYFGGMLNPIVALLALFALASAVKLQGASLDLARRELAETRKALTESVEAQNASQRALNAQVDMAAESARFNAITALLEAKRKQQHELGQSPSNAKRVAQVATQIARLEEKLEAEYNRVAGEDLSH